MRRLSKRLSVLALAGLALILPGCWDRTEINDIAFVLISAMDKAENGLVRFTMMIPLPGQMGGPGGGGGGTSGNKSYYIDSETDRTFREARAKLQKRMSRRMFFAHRRVVVVGESLAREGINEVIDELTRMPESRMSIYMIISEGDGTSLLKSSPKLERFPAEAIRELTKEPGVMPINLKEIAVSLGNKGSDPVITYMGTKKPEMNGKASEEVQILGYAQFRQSKMVGVFREEAAIGLTWLRNQHTYYITSVKTKNDQLVTLNVFAGKTKIDADIRDDRLHFTIRVTARARVLENTGGIDFHQISNNEEIERLLAENIRQSIQAAVKQMQREGTDSASLGTQVFRRHPMEWQRKLEDRWPDYLKNAEFTYRIDTQLADTGLTLQNVTKGESVQ